MLQTKYQKLYQESIDKPETFWRRQAEQELEWFHPFDQAHTGEGTESRWFVGGTLNITHNCLDRHVRDGKGNHLAYIYTNERGEEQRITYSALLSKVNQAVHALARLGVGIGDRVAIYMPLTIEQIIFMLACARMGAIHVVVYAGFSAESLATRIQDTGAKVVCTATMTQKNGKEHDLLSVVRQALTTISPTPPILVLQRIWRTVSLLSGEVDMQQALAQSPTVFAPMQLESSTPLFILHTSGTTGKPKGIVHGHGGYGLFTHLTMKHSFDVHPGQIHFTAADTGWITGHSYIVYGALSNSITSIIYEGSPLFPTAARYAQLIEQYKIESFYTAPTVIRLLKREQENYAGKYNLSSLRVIGSVGEPISPSISEWYATAFGGDHTPVIDTWWQTETGGHLLVTLPGIPSKPGFAGLPFFGIQPCLLDTNSKVIEEPGVIGQLAIKGSWPGTLRTCWEDDLRFASYFKKIDGVIYFLTGDLAVFDTDRYFKVQGRADDVINVGGVRIGTAEIEGALVAHRSVAEAAVVGIPDLLRGQVAHAFVVLNTAVEMHDAIERELQQWVRLKIGYIAEPAHITVMTQLPKTRSGKIMRRILQAKIMGLSVGDTSAYEDT